MPIIVDRFNVPFLLPRSGGGLFKTENEGDPVAADGRAILVVSLPTNDPSRPMSHSVVEAAVSQDENATLSTTSVMGVDDGECATAETCQSPAPEDMPARCVRCVEYCYCLCLQDYYCQDTWIRLGFICRVPYMPRRHRLVYSGPRRSVTPYLHSFVCCR